MHGERTECAPAAPRTRSPKCPPARTETDVLRYLLGGRTREVGDVDDVAVVVRADEFPIATGGAPRLLLDRAWYRGIAPLDASTLWILRFGIVHILGPDAAALHRRRLEERTTRDRAASRLADLRVALRRTLVLHPGVLGRRLRLDQFDASPSVVREIYAQAEQLLALVDSARGLDARPQIRRVPSLEGLDARCRRIWKAVLHRADDDLPRLVFAAACREAGLRWPYEAAMVAALEANNTDAMRFGSGSRLLDPVYRRHALDYWRKAFRDLDVLLERRAVSENPPAAGGARWTSARSAPGERAGRGKRSS